MQLGTEKETRGIFVGGGRKLGVGVFSLFFEESKILSDSSSDTVEI